MPFIPVVVRELLAPLARLKCTRRRWHLNPAAILLDEESLLPTFDAARVTVCVRGISVIATIDYWTGCALRVPCEPSAALGAALTFALSLFGPF